VWSQEVVTYGSPVEAFLTRIKMNSNDQLTFLLRADQGIKANAERLNGSTSFLDTEEAGL